ncbi:hypothetical protein [Bifidobacterium sp. SO1]|uniref:hypothetical protein n=1 Tax=Bifidobacterium sp. SO1 TaxID=2809029 RepID=UPI001BDCB303|nr:hypothetical protein [Bifidobacterium sp. SO1]MBT1160528.1 hypothetical protein [Bifidobacterium sp. SO1]
MRTNTALHARYIEAERHRLCIWGLTDAEQRAIRRRAQAGELVRVFDACYVQPDPWNNLDPVEQYRRIARTLTLRHPNWLFCDMSAAAMYGINDSIRHLDLFHIATNRQRHGHDSGRVRRHFVSESDWERSELVDGVRVTPLPRTIYDCTRRLDFADGLCVAEAALRNNVMQRDEMREHCLTLPGRFRSRSLLAVDHAPGGTENGGEAYSYAVMVEEGFVPPRVQEEIVNPYDLAHRDRVDFAWRTRDGRFIVGELDGRVKYRDPSMYVNGSLQDTVIAEKEREERIRLVADEMFRFSFADAFKRRDLIAKMEKAGVPRVR